MPKANENTQPSRHRTSLYQEITDKIIAELEAGRVPWVQPWGTTAATASLAMPKNAATKRRYSGINVLILWSEVIERGFAGQSWLTFRQAFGLGGHVRKGEHGTTIVYADRFVPDEERRRAERDGDEPEAIPFLRRFTVFNTDQCEDLPTDLTTAPPPVSDGLILPQAEALIAATGADFRIGGDRAFYVPSDDSSRSPGLTLTSSRSIGTGRPSMSSVTGSERRTGSRAISRARSDRSYMPKEELVAEMTSAFVCASLDIVPTVRHADYLGSWLEVLREDNRAIIRAASAASKAADYLLAFLPATPISVDMPTGAATAGAEPERKVA